MRKVGEYELIQKLGTGGMGEVWLARGMDASGATDVAIKLLSGQHANQEKQRELFIREARLSKQMRHGNIVSVYAAGEADGQAYMVMEWVDGMNLGTLMKAMSEDGAAFSLRVTAYIIGQILIGLDFAHSVRLDSGEQGIIHRDISPQNILISNFGEVRIADFGVARAVSEETSGELRGKLGYLAPEQLQGGKLDARVDLYAVGVLLHELADGSRFRQARDHNHMYSLVMSGELAPLRRTSLPKELDRLREALLQPDPSERVATAAEARELLGQWPGYGDASLELRRVIAKYSGVDAPRSGFHAAASASASHAAASNPGAETRTTTASHGPGQGSASASLSADVTREALPSVTVAPEEPRNGRGALLMVAGVAAIVLGAGAAAMLASGDDVQPDAVAATEPVSEPLEAPMGVVSQAAATPVAEAPAGEPEPVAAPEPEPEPAKSEPEPAKPEPTAAKPQPAKPSTKPKPKPKADPTPEKKPEPKTQPKPTSEPEAKPEPKPEAKKPEPTPEPKAPVEKATKPATLTVNVGELQWAYVKVAGRVHTAQPFVKNLQLKPGKHSVYVSKESKTSGFEKAGRVEVESGKRYELRLRADPLGVSIKEAH